jgi:hypothetical protein
LQGKFSTLKPKATWNKVGGEIPASFSTTCVSSQ